MSPSEHLPTRLRATYESVEDAQLRTDIRSLLGLSEEQLNQRPSSISEELHLLSQNLYQEAIRRKRTLMLSKKTNWWLAAAMIPLVCGFASWGYIQKQRTDQLAQQVKLQEAEQQRLLESNRQLQRNLQEMQAQSADPNKAYPVIPLERKLDPNAQMNSLKVRDNK